MRVLLKYFAHFLRGIALYLLVVVGGLTSFLILAPLFGYLPYSDRPGVGWFASFPGIPLTALPGHALDMAGLGLFLAMMFAIGGGLVTAAIAILERLFRRRLWVARAVGGLAAGFIAGYSMLMAGWYIAAGAVLYYLALALGVIAGAIVMPGHTTPRIAGA